MIAVTLFLSLIVCAAALFVCHVALLVHVWRSDVQSSSRRLIALAVPPAAPFVSWRSARAGAITWWVLALVYAGLSIAIRFA